VKNSECYSRLNDLGTISYVFGLDGALFCDPMDLFGHIKLMEMLGDLTVAMFLILLAASVVVVSLMVLFPLIDLAFEKKKVPLPYHGSLLAHDEDWQSGRPWLMLRSLRQSVAREATQLVSSLATARPMLVPLEFSKANYWTSLIKRTSTATQKHSDFIVQKLHTTPQKDDQTTSNSVISEKAA